MITKARVAHLALILVGLLIMVYPFTLGATETQTCRGIELTPGSICLKADGSAAESYADRRSKAAVARPVVVLAGLALAGFGVALLIGDLRKSGKLVPTSVER